MIDDHDPDDIWDVPGAGPRRTPRPARAEALGASSPAAEPARPRAGSRQPARWVEDPVAEPAAAARTAPLAGGGPSDATEPRPPRSWLTSIALVAVGAVLGGGAAAAATRATDPGPTVTPTTVAVGARSSSPSSSAASVPPPTGAATTTTVGLSDQVPTTAPPAPSGAGDDGQVAAALGPLTMPSDCGLPFGVAESLPNGARAYRGGVHEGIDFICGEKGRNAVAALDGQVVVANSSYVDPTNAEREEILATAKALGRTPQWTLAMLFGRVVVIDHGIRPGAGHVVTIYAHLNEIDPAIKPGRHVRAGDRLGEIGNLGTETAATGGTRPQSIHLHWEIHIDERFLGQGASPARTDQIYRTLFGR